MNTVGTGSVVVALGLAASLGLASCGDQRPRAAAHATTQTSTSVVTVYSTVPAPPDYQTATTTTTTTTTATTVPTTSTAARPDCTTPKQGTAVVPDVVFSNFGDATGALCDAGFTDIRYKTTNGKSVWNPWNWVVITQDPPAGTLASKTALIALLLKKSD